MSAFGERKTASLTRQTGPAAGSKKDVSADSSSIGRAQTRRPSFSSWGLIIIWTEPGGGLAQRLAGDSLASSVDSQQARTFTQVRYPGRRLRSAEANSPSVSCT